MPYAAAQTIGNRPYMEDTFCVAAVGDGTLFAVFDGHNGDRAAVLAAASLPDLLRHELAAGAAPPTALERAFCRLHEVIAAETESGTTASALLVTPATMSARGG